MKNKIKTDFWRIMSENSLLSVAEKYFSGGTKEFLLNIARRGAGRGKRKVKIEESNAEMASPYCKETVLESAPETQHEDN
jgi:hypothetical protein